jgi:hypothetical protein
MFVAGGVAMIRTINDVEFASGPIDERPFFAHEAVIM